MSHLQAVAASVMMFKTLGLKRTVSRFTLTSIRTLNTSENTQEFTICTLYKAFHECCTSKPYDRTLTLLETPTEGTQCTLFFPGTCAGWPIPTHQDLNRNLHEGMSLGLR